MMFNIINKKSFSIGAILLLVYSLSLYLSENTINISDIFIYITLILLIIYGSKPDTLILGYLGGLLYRIQRATFYYTRLVNNDDLHYCFLKSLKFNLKENVNADIGDDRCDTLRVDMPKAAIIAILITLFLGIAIYLLR